MPPRLEEYYQSLWENMRGEGLSEVELGVLNLLVEQQQPVSAEAIRLTPRYANADIIDVDEYDVEEVLENWRSLLHQPEIDGEICYCLYHWSFRKFLQSIIPSSFVEE
ncbi:hypothetical protein [Limnoraphis robusta]|uniref:Uncharacterized protein n=1 Tax=Limnoraphis robusta CCNP1315 TaxID=3110306 RepID=A0ABU5U3S3_9CYAN|nr:hypothetical protein [Limnoraphis robusta]MEA5521804.1 hypothetical protein [Limnoraphis robusta CCNP1315]MEA5544000.1 hypothetical protein [Limnoraphis robusta CCNP1324]